MSSELACERFDGIYRESQQILERWNDRLVFPPTKLVERYLGAHIDLHVQHRVVKDEDVSRLQFPRHLLTISSDLHIANDVVMHLEDGQQQLSVLVEPVHIVNEPKRVASRVSCPIRLQALNSCQSGETGNSLYFSTITGKFFLRSAAPPECDRIPGTRFDEGNLFARG